jgi:hypothetical protein
MLTRAFRMVAFAALAFGLGCGGSAPDRNGCCPPDPTMSGCTHLGGYSPGGCRETCDFFCSTNWRIERDTHGCSTWRYDTRAPQPGENQACLPALDGGGGADAGPG